jgi:hypothetical protein
MPCVCAISISAHSSAQWQADRPEPAPAARASSRAHRRQPHRSPDPARSPVRPDPAMPAAPVYLAKRPRRAWIAVQGISRKPRWAALSLDHWITSPSQGPPASGMPPAPGRSPSCVDASTPFGLPPSARTGRASSPRHGIIPRASGTPPVTEHLGLKSITPQSQPRMLSDRQHPPAPN